MSTACYTSELAAAALFLKPAGTPHKGDDDFCSLCGRPIVAGDLAERRNFGKSFTDHPSLGGSDLICGFCNVTATSQPIMRLLQRALVTPEGIYSMGKDENRAWFWMHPPAPPWTLILNHNTTATFHYFWRTPVTLDSRLVMMNVDNVLYQVSRERVMQAIRDAQLVMDEVNRGDLKKKLASPFLILQRAPTKAPSSSHGICRKEVLALLNNENVDAGLREAVQRLQTLDPGELIALSPFLKSKPSQPVQPEITRSLSS